MLRFIKQLAHIYLKKKVPRAAAELSYCLTLSIFPLLICLNAMLGSLNLSEAEILNYGQGIIPATTLKIISDYVKYVNVNFSPAMLLGALMLVFTSSSAAFRSIMGIMSEIQGRHRYKGFWPTVFSVVYSLIFLAAIYLSLVVIVTGNWFIRLASEHMGLSRLGGHIWSWLRFALLFVILLVIIYGIYRLSAPREKPGNPRILGAFIASVALVGVSMFFSWTIELSTQYSLVYGSIASIIILMIWFFICGIILIMGDVINFVRNSNKNIKNKMPSAAES
ncbi:MAG: YihY/virulence factor BrkB family protein [Clostridiales bacterium]|nr:YihY/virulence factor BrkB family protein [Clostridiales bacterium]